MGLKIGINGLGRIGRGFLRQVLRQEDLTVAAINDRADPETLAHLLRHDSLYGRLEEEVRGEAGRLTAGSRTIRCTRAESPRDIPWRDSGVAIVLEATGAFTTRAAASGHLDAGAERVILSAPSADADLTVCYGVNQDQYDPARHRVVSNASCTTNAMAAILSVCDEAFGLERVAMTTVHCYTNNQVLVDAPHSDRRRARAAGLSMIPTSTTAAAAIVQVLPQLRGKVQALAVRVPTAAVSLLDLTLLTRRATTLEAAHAALREAAEGRLRGVLGYSDEELVSIDYLGDTRSAVVDAPLLQVEGDRLVKIYAWYDNERAYVQRLVDVIRRMAGQDPSGRRN
ncbi:MAG TPA: type I glyceraldehyde-3-phosphate dehydrogenase [Candidatus Polarisedimenticolia bacterium]